MNIEHKECIDKLIEIGNNLDFYVSRKIKGRKYHPELAFF